MKTLLILLSFLLLGLGNKSSERELQGAWMTMHTPESDYSSLAENMIFVFENQNVKMSHFLSNSEIVGTFAFSQSTLAIAADYNYTFKVKSIENNELVLEGEEFGVFKLVKLPFYKSKGIAIQKENLSKNSWIYSWLERNLLFRVDLTLPEDESSKEGYDLEIEPLDHTDDVDDYYINRWNLKNFDNVSFLSLSSYFGIVTHQLVGFDGDTIFTRVYHHQELGSPKIFRVIDPAD